MKKQTLKQISIIANALPQVQYHAALYPSKITGEDVLLSGTKEINGEDVDPLKEYVIKTPLIREVDHKMRLKNAYNKNGRAGVIAYLRPYIRPESFGKVQVAVMSMLK